MKVQRGRIGELRVEVDERTAVRVPALSFTLPSRLTSRVIEWLAANPAPPA